MTRTLMTIGITLSTMGSLFGQAAIPLAFEVASVKSNKSGAGGTGVRAAPNGNMLTAFNATARRLIMRAYNVADWQISGGPAWLDSERYDIEAKPEHPVSSDQLFLMLRTLLTDRFKLTMHRETLERPLYVLLVDKGGPKLNMHQAGGNDQEIGDWNDYQGSRHAAFNNAGMSRLAFFLTVQSGRDVVDKTGLEGRYDFVLDFVPMRNAVDFGNYIPPPGDPYQAGILTAVKEQLGLKLESQKGPVERFRIDSLERPAEN